MAIGTMTLKISIADPPQVSKAVYLAVTWLSVSIAAIFVMLRAFIQLRYVGRLRLDDYLVAIAFVLLIVLAIIYTVIANKMYFIFNTAAGRLPIPDGLEGITDLMAQTRDYMRHGYASMWIFWTCLWTVKAAFLAFFYPLSNGLKWDRRMWYAVAGFCAIAYIVNVVQFQFVCGTPNKFMAAQCLSKTDIKRQQTSLRVSTAFDIVSDLLIMILPWKLVIVIKKSLKEKLSIGCIIGLGIFIVVFSAIRMRFVNTAGIMPAPVWVQMWSMIEVSVALIVISSTTLRVLITKSRRPPTNGYYGTDKASGMGSGIIINKGVSVEWSQRSISMDGATQPIAPKNAYRQNSRTVDNFDGISEDGSL